MNWLEDDHDDPVEGEEEEDNLDAEKDFLDELEDYLHYLIE